MDTPTRAWLTSQLGTDTDLVDLDDRYTRLGTARAVAVEILTQRHADLLASPTVVGVSGVVNINSTANLAGLERRIAELQDPTAAPAPDETGYGDDSLAGVFFFRERPRR